MKDKVYESQGRAGDRKGSTGARVGAVACYRGTPR
jgi:hypothetical protein